MMTRQLASLAALVSVGTWLAGCATGALTAAPPPNTAPVPTIRPGGIAWQLAGAHDFEPNRPGLGRRQRYESAVGWVDVYHYGLGRTNWATGVADPAFDAHFRSTINEVRQLAQWGQYTDLRIGPTRDTRIGGLDFRTVSYQFSSQGRSLESRTFMTGLQGQLLKYRMNFPSPVEGDVDEIARDFIDKDLRNATGAIDASAPRARANRSHG
jgi:hypothetical protein